MNRGRVYTASHAVKLTSWRVQDAAGHSPSWRRSSWRRANVKIHTEHGSGTHKNVWGSGNYIGNNDGDTATLKRPSGSVSDRCHYSDPGENNDHVNC
jgi:hypothetical protein